MIVIPPPLSALCMKHLYAPWRTEYTQSVAHTKNEHAPADTCIFCTVVTENNDELNFVLKRFKHTYVLLNRFPYNAGHLLVLPYVHQGELDALPQETRIELMEVSSACASITRKILKAEGVNLGLNLGKAAGAGMPAHLHMHVLPRWIGDTNFLPTLNETKAISIDLSMVYNDLKPHLDALVIE